MGALPFLGRRRRPDVGLALLLALVGFAVVSMLWSIGTPQAPNFHRYKEVEGLIGLKLVFELALYGAFVVAMQGVSDRTAARTGLVLAVGMTAMCLLLVLEAFDGAALYVALRGAAHQAARPDIALRDAARGAYVGAVLLWPCAARLAAAHRPAAAVLLALGLLVAAGVRRFGPPAVFLCGVLAILYLALAPLAAHSLGQAWRPEGVAGGLAKQSWVERLDIWRFTAAEIVQNPLRGYGLDASRAFSPDIPVHPHDGALQLWLELGVIGVCLAALVVGWLIACLARLRDRTLQAAGAAALSAYLVIGALSFGVWQEWWLALAALAFVFWRFLAAALRSEAEAAAGLVPLPSIR
jgi:O-antigen ligase